MSPLSQEGQLPPFVNPVAPRPIDKLFCRNKRVVGPAPWKRFTVSAATKPGTTAGVMTNTPSGLRWSEASFARNLL